MWLGWFAVCVLALVFAVGAACMFVEFPGDWEPDDEEEGNQRGVWP